MATRQSILATLTGMLASSAVACSPQAEPARSKSDNPPSAASATHNAAPASAATASSSSATKPGDAPAPEAAAADSPAAHKGSATAPIAADAQPTGSASGNTHSKSPKATTTGEKDVVEVPAAAGQPATPTKTKAEKSCGGGGCAPGGCAPGACGGGAPEKPGS